MWGRGAVDMLNLTASQAVAFRRLADSGFKPKGTLIYLAVADEEALGTWGADWLVEHERDAVYADYVLTESGGFQIPTPDGPAPAGDRRREGHVLVEAHACTARPATARSRSAPTTRSSPRPRSCAASPSTGPPTQIHDVVAPVRRGHGLSDPSSPTRCSTPTALARRAATSCRSGWRAIAHACTHTTFAPTVVHGGTKTNVIPDRVELEVDIRTLPGQTRRRRARACSREALGDLADEVEIESNDDPSTASPIDTPLWDSLGARDRPALRGLGAGAVRSWSAPPTTASSAAPARSATASGCSSQRLAFEDYATMFHGNDERVDQESLALSTQLWEAVARDLVG